MELHFVAQSRLFCGICFPLVENGVKAPLISERDAQTSRQTCARRGISARYFNKGLTPRSHLNGPCVSEALPAEGSPSPSVCLYAFDPRRTSRFAFQAFRPQSLLGYLLSPPALSTIISQQEGIAATRPRYTGDETYLTRGGFKNKKKRARINCGNTNKVVTNEVDNRDCL